MNFRHTDVTGMTIRAFYNVYNTLGYGFLEKVYEHAMLLELKKLGIKAEAQKVIQVYYDDTLVGNYYADLLVEDKVIVELKAATTLMESHEAQLLNYLKATQIEVGLLLNFGEKPQISRKIFDNKFK